ncbi:30S ribosomal protein S8 [Microgenomates group bacterium RBG_16_45_19]|nr:ribosomal protein S8 [uncultured bacterium]OGV95980.1 MAG: 30S ribosomal protein S8 [Microgenomates group bacterium RBG_16_45_19]
MTDPIADMLTRIRNALRSHQAIVLIPHSKVKEAIAVVLKQEQYINDYRVTTTQPKVIELNLRYVAGQPAISHLKRLSKPGRRLYTSAKHLPSVLGGYGLTILTTNQGILTTKKARKANLGGEVLCQIY